MSGRNRRLLPGVPLAEALEDLRRREQLTYRAFFAVAPINEREFWRWKSGGNIGFWHADRLCVRFGLHPWEVWGEVFFEVGADTTSRLTAEEELCDF